MSQRRLIWTILFLAIFIMMGCSSSENPSQPSFKKSSTHSGNKHLWGYWIIELDPVSHDAKIIPIRSAMFNANVLLFMQPPSSPIHMLSISIDMGDSDILNHLIAVDVTLRHPFPGVNKYRGFDVRGIFMADGSRTAEFDNSITYADWFAASAGVPGPDSVLLNADGYTRWWNPEEFTSYGTILGYIPGGMSTPDFYADATINPFKYFADELDSEPDYFEPSPLERGTFSTEPGTNTRRYLIQFNGTPLTFNYAVDASWTEPDPSYAPDYPVEAFDLSANCQEAFKIYLVSTGSTAWYQDSGNYGGEFIVDVEIYDWQALNISAVESEISGLWIESPAFDDGSGNNYIDLLAGPYNLFPGYSMNSAIFRATVNPDFSTGGIDQSGDYPVLIAVESSQPDSYEPQIDGGDMFDYPDAPLTAFNVGRVHVLSEDPNPQQTASIVFEDPQEFPAAAVGYDAYSPCVIEENDGDLCFAYAEWLAGSYDSYQAVYRSHDDGATWPDWRWNQHFMGGGIHAADTVKLWPSSHDLSYQICNLSNDDESVYFAGHASGTFPDGPNGSEKANNFNMSIDHASEIIQDFENYVYLLGDSGGEITFKRSTYPECLNCDTFGWAGFPTYPIVNPGRLSRVRSSVLFNDTMYLAYYEPGGTVIRLAHDTTDGFTWDTSTVVWDSTDSDWHSPRDPGLHIDETGFHIVFVRTEYLTGFKEICYTFSSDGSGWSDPVVIRSNVFDLIDAPICRYYFDTISVLATVWWENEHIWTSFSLDDGVTWESPVRVSEDGNLNKQCDLVISSTGNWHFVFACYNESTSLWDIHYRRAHLEWD